MKLFGSTNSKKSGLTGSLLVWGLLFLVFLGLMAWAFYRASTLNNQTSAYLGLAADMRLDAQKLSTSALRATQGSGQDLVRLKQLKQSFESSLEQLKLGNAEINVPVLPVQLQPDLVEVDNTWEAYKEQVDVVLSGGSEIASVSEYANSVKATIPDLTRASNDVVEAMLQHGAEAKQVFLASRQLELVQRIEHDLNSILTGDVDSLVAADQFGRNAALFGQVLEGMINGNSAAGITRVDDAKARKALKQVAVSFSTIGDNTGAILEASPVLYQIRTGGEELNTLMPQLAENSKRLESAIKEYGKQANLWSLAGFVLGTLALLSFLALASSIYRGTRKQLSSSEQQNNRNQRAILQLLDEMSTLAEGDLRTEATVTEDITGAIADSVNYAIEALRTLVRTINDTSTEVANSAEQTLGTAKQLAKASERQTSQINTASAAVAEVSRSMELVAKDATDSAEVAEQSVGIANEGAQTVRKTMESMDAIRQQIQDTSKRIKRLGESSQEIGDIVSLINDIADQTNILALNAAIQASAAGEAGRGFAVVADEVQRLAERSASATKQIEALVKTIQTDTHEAVSSMELSTANVVEGTKQAETAGQALTEIETVSHRLAGLIESISSKAREQASVSGEIADSMGAIREIAAQTSAGTEKTASAVGGLAELASDLRYSVEGFKLPEQDSEMLDDDVDPTIAIDMNDPSSSGDHIREVRSA